MTLGTYSDQDADMEFSWRLSAYLDWALTWALNTQSAIYNIQFEQIELNLLLPK